MKIYLKFPIHISDSMYYRYLLEYPPDNVSYITETKTGILKKPFIFRSLTKIKSIGRFFLNIRNVPLMVKVNNIYGVDLIHCAHCLPEIRSVKNIDWIVDFEHYWTLASSKKIAYSDRTKKIIKKILSKKNCKLILPWTYSAKETLTKSIGKNKDIDDKIHVIYPAIPKPKIKTKRKMGEKINILFVGRYFFNKGGLYFLEVMKRIVSKYDNVTATLVSYTIPKIYEKKYGRYVIIKHYVTSNELFNYLYPNSHIFFYPGFSDTFGFSLIEAMSYGLFIVTVNGFSRKEIIRNKKSGFIINIPKKQLTILEKSGYKLIINKIVNELEEKIDFLINHKKTLIKSRKYNIKFFKDNFSIEKRNKSLGKLLESLA